MPAKSRICITIDRETLHLADYWARIRGTSRSEFFCAAIRALAAGSKLAPQAEELRKQRRKAIGGIRRIAKQAGDWPAEQIVHDMRYGLLEGKKE